MLHNFSISYHYVYLNQYRVLAGAFLNKTNQIVAFHFFLGANRVMNELVKRMVFL